MSGTDTLNKLGDRVELAAALIATNVAGARRRPLTVGEFLAGRIAASFDVAGAEAILRDAVAAITADPTACFVRHGDDGALLLTTLAEAADTLRSALAEAEPFTIKKEEAKSGSNAE